MKNAPSNAPMPAGPMPAPHRVLEGLILFTALIFAACSSEPPRGVLLRDVQIIDLENAQVVPGQSLWLVDGKIADLGPADALDIAALETIEGDGRYVLPGLIDAHVHVDHPDELTLYPAYGVTSVFVLRGVPHHLRWRQWVRSGERIGPGLYLTGDYLEGDPPTMEPMMTLSDPQAAREAVRRQAQAGYDFVKVYTRLSVEQLNAITEEARAHGLCVLGHGGRNYDLEHLIASGQDNLAHGQDLIRWYLEEDADTEDIEHLVRRLASSEITVTPNLAWTDALIRQGEDLDAILATAEARRLHPAILQPFRRSNNRFVHNAEEWLPSVRARFEVEKQITHQLHEAGVPLLAGTDASTATVFPGDSLLREIELLTTAGLEPVDALRAATLNPGRFLERCLGSAARVGRLDVGYEADLLLLDRNPLEDLGALRDIAGVALDGRWYTRDALDSEIDTLEQDYVALGGEVVALEQALFSGDAVTARQIFDQARSERPGEVLFSQYVPFFVGYGFLYGEEGISTDPERLAVALALYEMYVETYPDYHSGHYLLALARRASGDLAGARESLGRAIEIHPGYAKARSELDTLLTDAAKATPTD